MDDSQHLSELTQLSQTAGTLGRSIEDQILALEKRKEELETQEQLQKIKSYPGLEPFELKISQSGKVSLPEDPIVAEKIYDWFDGNLIKFEKTVFIWDGMVWNEWGEAEHDKVIQLIIYVLNNHGNYSKLSGIRNLFLNMIPVAPRSPFVANPYISNFIDGTLRIYRSEGKWAWSFGDHDKEDYLTNVIPFKFDVDRSIKNQKFEDMVTKILGPVNFDERLRALKQMYGACLCPAFPRFFMIFGPGNSGKSSLIKPALALVDESNVSSVQPHEMDGFNLESMINKLVNFNLDIETSCIIKDSIIKNVEDRVKFRINRKFKPVIMGSIPAVHIYGGNDIPNTIDRGSGAHTRRWTFLKVDSFNGGEVHDRDYAVNAFKECPEGVLNFAFEGLLDLLANNGLYTNSSDGKLELQEWQLQNDSVGLFLKEIREDGIQSLAGKTGFKILENEPFEVTRRIERGYFWNVFTAWHKESYNRPQVFGRNKFYKYLRAKGIKFLKSGGVNYIESFFDTAFPRGDIPHGLVSDKR